MSDNQAMHPYGASLAELATSRALWAQLPTIPNILSIARAFGVVALVWLVIAQWNTIWPAACFVLLGITDLLDGYLAKHHGMSSDLGKILDTLADKLLVVGCLLALTVRLGIELAGAFALTGVAPRTLLDAALLATLVWVTAFTAVRDVLVTRMRLHQVVLSGRFESAIQAGRVKMAVQVVVVTLLLLPIQLLPFEVYIWVGAALLLLMCVMARFTQSSWRAYVRDNETRARS